MLPPVSKLMPPVLLDDFVLVDLVDCPQVPLLFVEEDCLVYWLQRLCVVSVFLCMAELVLVVGAVKGHFDQAWVVLVRVCVVHWSEPVRR